MKNRPIQTGDLVQWTNQGAAQFATPRIVRAIHDLPDGTFALVEGSNTGIPLEELSLVKNSKRDVVLSHAVKLLRYLAEGTRHAQRKNKHPRP